MRLTRRTLLHTAAAGSAATLTRGASAQPQPRKGGTLRFALANEVRRMNQLNTTWMTNATQHLFDRLLTRDPNGKYVRHMADWTVSADGLIWTFKLRPGIRFHSGDACTSAAVKWWFDQARDPKGFYGFKGSYSSVDSVETPDDLTAVVHLKHPDAALAFILYTVYSSIHNPQTYERVGKDAYGVDVVDGTGPFKMKNYTPGGDLTIVRNDAYAWAPRFVQNQGPPWLDAIQYRYFADDAARTAALEAGDMDIIEHPSVPDMDRLKQNPNIMVLSRPAPATRTVYYNLEVKPWDDKRVRQAMAHAIQRQPIVDKLLFGQGLPAYSIVPPFFTDVYLKDCESYFPYDIKAAKELLAAAGLNETDSEGYVRFQGKTWEPEMLVTGTSELVQLAQVVQAQAAKIGIKTKIVQLDAETNNARTLAGKFDIQTGFYSWDGPDTILDWWLYSGNIPSTNRARIRDARIDSEIEKMRNSATLDERYAHAKEIQRVLHGDLAAIIPVYHPLVAYGVSKKVQGFVLDPMTIVPRMHDVWLES
jgi:peptide/nickel transport system substrate-binding protein